MKTTATPTSLGSSASMIQDYLQILEPPVTNDARERFAVVQRTNDGQRERELLTVDNQNRAIRFYADKASDSGWSQEVVPVVDPPTAAISKLIAFYQGETLNLLVHYPVADSTNCDVVWMQRSASGSWTKLSKGDAYNATASTSQTDAFVDEDGSVFLYGVATGYPAPSFFIAAGSADGSQWTVPCLEPTKTEDAVFRLAQGSGTDQFTALLIEGPTVSYRCGSIVNGQFAWAGDEWRTYDLKLGTLLAEGVLPPPTVKGRNDVLVMTPEGTLVYVDDYQQKYPTLQYLSGEPGMPKGVTSVAMGLNAANQYVVFVTDTTNQALWLLAQTGVDSGGRVLFGDWVPLGNVLSTIACPLNIAAQAEVMAVTVSRKIIRLYQTADATWFTNQLMAPSAQSVEPTEITSYSVELIGRDANGRAVPSTVMNVTPDRAATLIANGVAFTATPVAPVQLVSDMTGRLAISIPANDLTAALLRVNVPAFMAPGQSEDVALDTQMFQRMAGEDPTFAVTAAALKSAGVMPQDFPSEDADTVADSLKSVGAVLVSMRTAARARRVRRDPAYFRISLGGPARISVRRLSSVEGAALMVPSGAPGAGSLSSAWGDFVQFLKSSVDKVVDVVMSIVDDVINLVMTVAGEIVSFTLDAVDQVGDLVELLFSKLGEAFEQIIDGIRAAIEWLRMLFDWEDIKNTQKVVKYYVNSGLTRFGDFFDDAAVKWVQGQFDSVKTQISDSFDQAKTIFGAETSFNSWAATQPGGSSTALAGANLWSAFDANTVRCNYVWNKALTYFDTLSPEKAPSPNPAFQSVLDLMQQLTSSDAYVKAQTGLETLLQTLTDPAQFFNLTIGAFLDAVESLVLFVVSAAEAIVLAALRLVAATVGAVQKLLNAEFEIPILTSLFKMIFGGDSLSMLDLVCFIIATPLTILYKLVFGGDSLTAPFTAAQVTAIQKAPAPWPGFPFKATGAGAEASAAGPAPETVLASLFCVLCIGQALFDVATDLIAFVEPVTAGMVAGNAKLIGGVSLGIAILAQALTVGYRLSDWSTDSVGDQWAVISWTLGWFPILTDSLFMAGTGSIAKFGDEIGTGFDSVIGLILLAIGITATVKQASDEKYNGWNLAENIIAPIPQCVTFFLSTKLPGQPYWLGARLALDAVCDVGAGVSHVAGA
jgi:hypothetical protein